MYVECTHKSRGDSYECTTYHYDTDRKDIPKLYPFASSRQRLELPMSRINLQGPKDVRIIEVQRY